MSQNFDVIVIGAGPGGYVAAIKAAQSGRSVALVERDQLGGSCLNCGCIPTKTLLANAEIVYNIKRAKQFGITVENVSFDYSKMKERKDDVINKIRSSLEGLIKSNKITIIMGSAEFVDPKTLKVVGDETQMIKGDKIIIATGSKPMDIPSLPCDYKKVHNSTSMLNVTVLPKSMVIVGGGYIGCEFASLYSELGTEVTIVEALDSIVQVQGKSISSALTKAFQKRGITLETGVSVKEIKDVTDGVEVMLSDGRSIKSEIALISIGRSVVSDSMKIENAGLATGARGVIEVDSKMQTSVPGIYAIGDVTGKMMLAHVASHQGVCAAKNACGEESYMHYDAVPAVIFTAPEIAMVGMNFEDAKDEGYAAKSSKFPLQALGKAQATMDVDGFVEMVVDTQTKQILGATIVGHGAADLISEMALAIQNELTVDCVIETIHAHPTMAEAWLEASLIANDTPIHFPPKI
ncbi:MAG: dihydrolipoyl dehydrogenase [Rhabdochlamydiaceae bacterium]|nr:dihydrolipoyl dehydrogenase [Candidatus Amphrikana amoebophyrae]